jgi:hypothetical protein
MRKILCVMTGLAALAMTANAHDIRFFASTSSTDGTMPDAIPVVEPGDIIYLWAATGAPGQQKWQGIDLALSNATGTVFNEFFTGSNRWEGSSDFELDPQAGVVGVQTQGLGGPFEALGSLFDAGSGHYAFAQLVAGEVGPIDLSVFAAVAAGSDKGDDSVAVAMGDLVPNTNIADEPVVGTIATVIPEPASLMLLGLAGLAIRRR